MSSIPEKFKVDFSGSARDMVEKAFSRLLIQFQASPVLKQFVAAFIRNGPQWVYDEIVKQQEANTLYLAEGNNLDAIGRIVGQGRDGYRYDDSRWMFSDRVGQGADQGYAWVQGASLSSRELARDNEYRQMILARIACNFNRFSSLPELIYLARFVTGETVSWQWTGPMECMLLVRTGISVNKLEMLTRRVTTTYADDVYSFPYPATLNLTQVMFVPERAFIADRGAGHQADAGLAAVARKLETSVF